MWLARNYDGDYVLSKHKLVRVINDDYPDESYWEFESCVNGSEEDNNALFGDKQDIYKNILEDLFPDLTWDDEPVEIELIPKTELVALKINNALYREEHSDCLWCSSDDETKVFDDYWTWEQTKCQQCKFFDGYDVCCKKGNFGTITTDRLNNCVIKHLFEKKD